MNLMCLLYDMYVILIILLCVYAQSLSCADTFLFFFVFFFFLSDSFQPMDCSLPGSSVHGILQARMLEWVSISSSSRSSDPGTEPMSFFANVSPLLHLRSSILTILLIHIKITI